MSFDDWFPLAALAAVAGLCWWFWPSDEGGRATAVRSTRGSTITIREGSSFEVNGKPISVPPGTYTEGLVANADGAFVGGQPIQH